jgi:hypothetical protein
MIKIKYELIELRLSWAVTIFVYLNHTLNLQWSQIESLILHADK